MWYLYLNFWKRLRAPRYPRGLTFGKESEKALLWDCREFDYRLLPKFYSTFLFFFVCFLFYLLLRTHGNDFWWFRTCEWRSLRYLFTCVVIISFTRIPQELYKGAVYSSRIRKVSPVFEAEIDILKAPSRTRWLRINWRMYYGIWKQLSRAAHLHLNQR